MGRNQRRKGGGQKRGRESEWTTDPRDSTTLYNAAFERYYRGKVVPEEEWAPFLASLQTPLPTALRVSAAIPARDEVATFVFDKLARVLRTVRLPFFSPKGLAMQCEASRGELKRNDSLRYIKKLIAALNEGGFLTRQETVSMIPPLLLDVRPGCRVLDMCSAPGSKTSQILETLVSQGESGCVVANDLNSTRLDVLNHQTNRTNGAQSRLIITNCDAMTFPLLSDPSHKFDRVLCDVMCSGDGTLRKSLDLWSRWNTLQGADLHASQVRVLTRGMQLCKKGGRVVYSTCSLNPVEDEAVVSTCLTRSKGTFRLVDPSPYLEGLLGTNGLETAWTVVTRDLSTEFSTIEGATEHRKQNELRDGGKPGFQYQNTMFGAAETLTEQNMRYAIRVLPHKQDTGGFFIAALECLDDYPDSLRPRAIAPLEKPFKPLSTSLLATVQAALALPSEFPFQNLVVRNESAREQKIYYATDDTLRMYNTLDVNIAQVGVKVFEGVTKHSNDKLRFSAEGVGSLAPLLPPNFHIRVEMALLESMAASPLTDINAFCDKARIPLDALPPHCFVIEAPARDSLGLITVAAERRGFSSVAIKVLDWQRTLCRHSLGLPILEERPNVGHAVQSDANGGELRHPEGGEGSDDEDDHVDVNAGES